MALVFAAIVPHSPVLIPSINQGQPDSLTTTKAALKIVAEALLKSGADTIIFLTSHLNIKDKAIIFNICPRFEINFNEFGDYSIKIPVLGDIAFANKLKLPFDEQRNEVPIVVTTTPILDQGTSIPLFYLLEDNPNIKLVVMGDTLPESERQFELGESFRSAIFHTHRHVAIIASANLSHRLSDESPAGFSPKAKAFDRRVLNLIHTKQPIGLARFHRETINEVQECGLRPMLTLFGMLSGVDYTPELLAYENSFGIGLPTILLKF